MTMLRKMLVLMTLLAAGGVLSACNTMSGAGKDIQAGGDAISDSAEKVKNKM